MAFDSNGNKLCGGVYDERMGPTSKDDGSCVTCGQGYSDCPGHLGRIELCVPVYNPLLFNQMLNFLKNKCQACHNFKSSLLACKVFIAKVNLIERGLLKDAMGLDEKLKVLRATVIKEAEDVLKGSGDSSSLSYNEDGTLISSDLPLHQFLEVMGSTKVGHDGITLNSHERTVKREIVKAFFLANGGTGNKCQNCNAFSPRVRHDASNKVFQSPLSLKNGNANKREKVNIVSATRTEKEETSITADSDSEGDDSDVEQDKDSDSSDSSDSDSDGMQINKALAKKQEQEMKKKNDKFMHPLEVMAQIRLTWKLHPFLCSRVFGSAHTTDNYKLEELAKGHSIFFTRVICVPPSRFRPPMILGNMTVEHSQNIYLNKMLLLNEKIRGNMATANVDGDGDVIEEEEEGDAVMLARKQTSQSENTLKTWIDLQLNFNCYIDSAKDPSANAANAPPGIRQLLERKEGIFRKHMMGKRVNYACRSVISPDPYIGTNEIGIPVKFARTLTYPTPVTTFNVAKMREAVIRGFEEYPGAAWVEVDGRRIDLRKANKSKREGIAARLLSGEQQVIVGRQLLNGDCVLMNRQVSFRDSANHKIYTKQHTFRTYQNTQTQNTAIIKIKYSSPNERNIPCTTPKIRDGLT